MKWQEHELEILKTYYEDYGPTFVSTKIDRKPRSISKKASRLNLKFDTSRFYKSDKFNNIVKNSKNLVDICRNLGLKLTGGNRNTIKKWIKVKNIDTSHFFIEKTNPKQRDINYNFFIENSIVDRKTIKSILYRENLKERKCELCGQDENWNGKKMSLVLDHINGINDDNRLENLRIVCPNCNAT